MEEEIWKDIPGYENCYQISNLGRIMSKSRYVDYHHQKAFRKGKLLRPGMKAGYLGLTLSKDANRKPQLVHRLVMLTFEGPCPIGLEVDHINNIKTDNRRVNLRYVTSHDNKTFLREKDATKSSRFVGVGWHKPSGKWSARIQVKGKRLYLGIFNTQEQANEAYQEMFNKINPNHYERRNNILPPM